MAPLVVRDHIAQLGESCDAFPMRRIDELIKLISPEIIDDELRSQFQKKIAEEIRSLGGA